MLKRLLCGVVWILPLLIELAECQQCRICGPEQEGGACRPNKLMDVPENITINDGMCTSIESTGYHKDVLCEEYKAPKGYFFECLDSTNSQFSCRSTCGPSLDSIGTGPEFDLLNQNGGLLLGKGTNKRGGLLDFSNFQNGGGFDFGLGNSFGQNNINPQVKAQTNRGSGASASASSANQENRQKASSSVGSGNQNIFNKDLFGDLGFNSFFPKKESTQNANVDNNNAGFARGNNLNEGNGNNESGQKLQSGFDSTSQTVPLKTSLHKERDTDNVVVPIDSPQIKDIQPGNPEKVKLVKIPDLQVNPSNLVIEPETGKETDSPNDVRDQALPNQKQTIQQKELPNAPVPNDPYSRYPKPRPQNPPPFPPQTGQKPQGIAVGEPNEIDLKPRLDLPPPVKPPSTENRPNQLPYKPPKLDNRADEFERQQPSRPLPLPPQDKYNPIQPPNNNDRYIDSPNPKSTLRGPNYPPPPSPSNNLPPVNNNQPQYPRQDPPQNQPPRRLPTYPNPTSNPRDPLPSRNSNVRGPGPQAPPRTYNNPPPQGASPSGNQRNSLQDPRGGYETLPANRQPDSKRQYPYGNNNGNTGNRYDDKYPSPPRYSDSNSNNGRSSEGLGKGSGVKAPEGLDGSRLNDEDGGLGKSVDFAGTSLMTDSDYLDRPSDGSRYKNKVPEEFEQPFKAENDIFPGFSNFANGDGDNAAFGTGKSVFNLFDGKETQPPGFKNGQFNFNNKDFLKPDTYNKGNGGEDRGDNSNTPTRSPSGYSPGSPPPIPRDTYNPRSPTPENRPPNSFRPTYQPSPSSDNSRYPDNRDSTRYPDNRDNSRYPSNADNSRYPSNADNSRYPNNGRNDLIRQNERKNPTFFDPVSSPSSNRPFLTAPNQNNPSTNDQRSTYPPQNQPPRNYPSPPPSNPQSDRYQPPQRQEDNSPPFNTNLRSPLNLFGGSLPFQTNSDTKPSNSAHNQPPPPAYQNPQAPSPRDPNFQGNNPYLNQPTSNSPYPPRNPGSFQGPSTFPQPSGAAVPRDNPYSNQPTSNSPYPPRNPGNFQGPNGFPQPSGTVPSRDNRQPQFQPQQNPGASFQPAGFPPIFDSNNNGKDNNDNYNPNIGRPGQNRFAPPGQPGGFQFPGNRDENAVPNVHVNNFLNSRPRENPYKNPQGGPQPQNNRPAPPGPASNTSPFPQLFGGNNQPPANNRGSQNTPYAVGSPSQTGAGRPNFELDFKPLGQPLNSRPDSRFNPSPQNSRPQPPQQPPSYSGPPSNDRGSGSPFSFGGLGSPQRPATPSYEPTRPGNDRNRPPFSFDAPPRGAPTQPRYEERPTGNPFSLGGPGRGPPPRNEPSTDDRIGANPFSFGNRGPNGPSPSPQEPPRPSLPGSAGPFSFGNRGAPQPFAQNGPPTNRNDNNPFSFGSSDRPSQPQSPFGQAPPARPDINPPNRIGPGHSAPPGNRFGPPYNPKQGGPPRRPFQQGPPGNTPPSRPSTGGDNSGLNALLDSSPFSFEDPTGSDQSIPSFGDKSAPTRQQPSLRPEFGGGLGYGPPDQSGRPSFVPPGPTGVQGGPYPQQGPSNVYPSQQERPEYNTVQPARGNSPFGQRNSNEFGFDSNFGQFDDANSPFKDRFTSDRFSDPEGYFGDEAFTDETTQEETNQTSNHNSSV